MNDIDDLFWHPDNFGSIMVSGSILLLAILPPIISSIVTIFVAMRESLLLPFIESQASFIILGGFLYGIMVLFPEIDFAMKLRSLVHPAYLRNYIGWHLLFAIEAVQLIQLCETIVKHPF